MRIAYLTQPYPPMVSGASIVAEQLATGIANRGHEVLVIAASDTGKEYVEKKQNLTVIRLKSVRNPLRVNQRIMFMQRHAVLKALIEFKPDIIHVHEPIQMGVVGLKYMRQANVPVVMTSHQLPWFVASYMPNLFGLRLLVEKLVWKYAYWLSRKYTSIISPTQTISNIIKSNTGLMPKTIHYGIDLNNFHANSCEEENVRMMARFNIPADVPIILHTGRLDADKNVGRIILASENVIKTLKAHLLVIGDGCEKNRLIELCKSLGIDDSVHFPGFISNKSQLAGIYRSANLFVTASEIETQGIVLLEAAASGLPIVAVNATCIPEIVHHGHNGYLATSENIQELSSHLCSILQNPTIAKMMSQESQHIAEKYSIEKTFIEHEKLYINLLRKPVENQLMSRKSIFYKWRKYLKLSNIFNR